MNDAVCGRGGDDQSRTQTDLSTSLLTMGRAATRTAGALINRCAIFAGGFLQAENAHAGSQSKPALVEKFHRAHCRSTLLSRSSPACVMQTLTFLYSSVTPRIRST